MHTRTLADGVRLAIGPAGAVLTCPGGERRAFTHAIRAALDARGLAAFPVFSAGDPDADTRFGPSTLRRAVAAVDAVWPPFVASLEDQGEPALERVGDRVPRVLREPLDQL